MLGNLGMLLQCSISTNRTRGFIITHDSFHKQVVVGSMFKKKYIFSTSAACLTYVIYEVSKIYSGTKVETQGLKGSFLLKVFVTQLPESQLQSQQSLFWLKNRLWEETWLQTNLKNLIPFLYPLFCSCLTQCSFVSSRQGSIVTATTSRADWHVLLVILAQPGDKWVIVLSLMSSVDRKSSFSRLCWESFDWQVRPAGVCPGGWIFNVFSESRLFFFCRCGEEGIADKAKNRSVLWISKFHFNIFFR